MASAECASSLMFTFFMIFDDDDEDCYDYEDEDDNEITIISSALIREKRMRTVGFVKHVVCNMSDIEFRRHYRLDRNTFNFILSKVEMALLPKGPGGSDIVPPSKQMLVFLWYLANQDSIREISLLFGLADSTVSKIILKVAKEICKQRSTFIRWPTDVRKTQIKAAFREISGFDGILGAIDGTHVRIMNLPGGNSDYFNRKRFPSIQLQVVVDDMLLINNTNVGWPGSAHDARVLRNSDFFEKANGGELFGEGEYVIGDSAYPLKKYIVTVFKDNGHLSRRQRKFNRLLSISRQVVERAIGRMKGRFRRLREIYCRNVRHICHLITAACALHNMCILAYDDVEIFTEEEDQHFEVNGYHNIFRNEDAAVDFRNRLLNQVQL